MLLGGVRHQGQERVRLLPQHVGIENPAVLESRCLGLPGQRDNALHWNIRFEGDPELHVFLHTESSATHLTVELCTMHKSKASRLPVELPER